MLNGSIYFPILKTKASELEGLAKLDEEILKYVTPIFDVIPVNTFQKNIPSLENHLGKIVEKLNKLSEHKNSIIIDLFELPLELRLENGDHPLSYLINKLTELEFSVVPSTGLERDQSYNDLISSIYQNQGNGILIRLLNDDLITPTIMHEELNELLDYLGIPESEIDLLIDLRDLHNNNKEGHVDLVEKAIAHISNLDKYRTVIISGSSMPRSIPELIQQSSSGNIRRLESDIWKTIKTNNKLKIEVAFSDYSIVTPEYVDVDPRIYSKTMGPKIIYTIDGYWFIVRGSSFHNHHLGHDQYYELAKTVVEHPEFIGAEFSFGDKYISDKADKIGGPGIPWNWLRAGINHHITYIVDSILE